jgi:eukaryotic-like serine/threonine-protein kinase
MTPERWRQVEHLYHAALARESSSRGRFLDEACDGDTDLRARVESMVEAHEHAGSFIQMPAFEASSELADPAPTMLPAGRIVGRYRVQSVLGTGGMGEVYLAEDTPLQRQVALKILPAGARDDDRMRRFQQEARAASSLSHQNVAHIYEIGEADGMHFIAMEYVKGEPLDRRIGGRPLPAAEVLEIGIQVADALDEAHARGVTHRDIKSANVLVTARGQVKVLDFGLAKMARAASGDGGRGAATQGMTTPGLVMGTPDYMSPEQALGREVDHRSDIFSLGVVLYEMATGRLPFRGNSVTETIDRIAHSEPEAIARLNPEIPEGLERVVGKTLRKDREERYQTVKDLLVDLRRLKEEGVAGGEQSRSGPANSRRVTLAGHRPRRVVVYGGIAAVGIAAAAALALRKPDASVPAVSGVATPIRTLAVLPLEDLSPGPREEYFADGVTDALINDLTQIAALTVRSRTSVMPYKGVRKTLAEIARELAVDGVLEGSVQRVGGRVRIHARLVDARTDTDLWSRSYDRDLRDVLEVESEVSRAIASEVRVKVTPGERQRLASWRPVDPAAHDAYLRGRHHKAAVTVEDLEKAIRDFKESIARDPTYAPAWAGLSDAEGSLAVFGGAVPGDAYPRARSAAARAIELDPELSDAHLAMALVNHNYDWDWAGAGREFERALDLNPGNAWAHDMYAVYLVIVKRYREAGEQVRRAIDLDPFMLDANDNLGFYFFYTRRYDEAVAQYRRTIALDPGFVMAHRELGFVLGHQGRGSEAVSEMEKAVALSRDSYDLASLGYAYGVAGRRRDAEAIRDELSKRARRGYVPSFYFAEIELGLGHVPATLDWLEKGLADRHALLPYATVDPRYEVVRSDPRYRALVRAMGLPS